MRSNFTRPSRGIRLGDPTFPYLFVLCIDKFSHLISHSVDKKQWKTIKVGSDGSVMSHLMSADDLLLFGKASKNTN